MPSVCFSTGAGVADDEGAERGAEDDQRFEGLDQHLEVAAHRDIAAEDASRR